MYIQYSNNRNKRVIRSAFVQIFRLQRSPISAHKSPVPHLVSRKKEVPRLAGGWDSLEFLKLTTTKTIMVTT